MRSASRERPIARGYVRDAGAYVTARELIQACQDLPLYIRLMHSRSSAAASYRLYPHAIAPIKSSLPYTDSEYATRSLQNATAAFGPNCTQIRTQRRVGLRAERTCKTVAGGDMY